MESNSKGMPKCSPLPAVQTIFLESFEHNYDAMGERSKGTSISDVAVELPPEAAAQLSELVSAVELWWFGGRELSRAEYERCSAAWDALRPALVNP